MKKRWIALVLAAAVVGLPSWGVLALTGAGTAAAGETESMQDTTRACVCAAEEAILSAAEPLRADIAETAEKTMRLTPPAQIDLGWWQSHYRDIIGYVYSPGTPISYPIAYDGDNDYYLHHDLYGNYSVYGTIFLDARANRDFTSQSNMLYGHHMADGTMFASISGYKQQWYYDAHPYFYLYTNAGTYRVDLFAASMRCSTPRSTIRIWRALSASLPSTPGGASPPDALWVCVPAPMRRTTTALWCWAR